MLTTFALILTAVIGVQSSCVPTNWNYPWLKVGTAWFTKLDTPRPWYEQMKKCGDIEKGRSSIASIRSSEEVKVMKHRFPGQYWMGGFEIERSGHWLWWNRGRFEEVKKFFWYRSEPDNAGGHSACMHFYHGWMADGRCDHLLRALCELRC